MDSNHDKVIQSYLACYFFAVTWSTCTVSLRRRRPARVTEAFKRPNRISQKELPPALGPWTHSLRTKWGRQALLHARPAPLHKQK
jgi:hypothetical protein